VYALTAVYSTQSHNNESICYIDTVANNNNNINNNNINNSDITNNNNNNNANIEAKINLDHE
jgi:hypothetical protein